MMIMIITFILSLFVFYFYTWFGTPAKHLIFTLIEHTRSTRWWCYYYDDEGSDGGCWDDDDDACVIKCKIAPGGSNDGVSCTVVVVLKVFVCAGIIVFFSQKKRE